MSSRVVAEGIPLADGNLRMRTEKINNQVMFKNYIRNTIEQLHFNRRHPRRQRRRYRKVLQ